jgi:uncharacterized protein YecE (DUF72 family)
MRDIGLGGQCAGLLFQWVGSVVEVLDLQRDFLHEVGGADPAWLTRHREYWRQRRALALEILVKERFCHFISAAMERDIELERFLPSRQAMLDQQAASLEDLRARLRDMEVRNHALKPQCMSDV